MGWFSNIKKKLRSETGCRKLLAVIVFVCSCQFLHLQFAEEIKVKQYSDWKESLSIILHRRNGPPFAYFDPRLNQVEILVFDRNQELEVAGNCRCGKNVWVNGKNPAIFPNYRPDMRFNALCNCGDVLDIDKVSIEWDQDNPDPARGKTLDVPSMPTNVPVVKIPKAPTKPRMELAICLAPLFGPYPYWLLLLQFIEVHRALGAAKFFVYYLNADDPATLAMLFFYKEIDPVIELIPLHPVGSPCGRDHYCRHDFQVQDCLLRARAHGFRYVAPIDIDELLLPQNGVMNYAQLLQNITMTNAHSYVLRHRWVFRNESAIAFRPDITDSLQQFLPINRYHSTTQIGGPEDTIKAIVDAEHSLYMGVHSMLHSVHGTRSYPVDPAKTAYIRHYRDIRGWQGLKQKLRDYSPLESTDFPPRLADLVLKSATRTLKYVSRLLDNSTKES